MTRKQRTRGRPVNGVLLLDKPAGITSNQVLQHVKRLYNASKAGHTGSLDKQATGLLPLCFGEATKLSGYLLDANKRYRAVCRLGITTSTGDASGEELSVSALPDIDRKQLEAVLQHFRGEISQVPPMHSALKHQGQRLYKLAHQGIEVEREPRQVMIYQLQVLDQAAEELEIDVICSKGTYIRTLAEDIGRELGCGAHIKSLRRTAAGPFTLDQAYAVERLEQLAGEGLPVLDALLQPMDQILDEFPDICLNENQAFYIRHGQAVVVPHAPTAGLVRIYYQGHQFMGIGEILEDGRVSPKRLLRTDTG